MDKQLALKAAVVILAERYTDDFVEQFGLEKLQQYLKDTELLKDKHLTIEEILYKALEE